MFIVIEQQIMKLSRTYDIVGIYNSQEEADIIASARDNTNGEYQRNHGYFYDCSVYEIDTSFTLVPNQAVYVLIRSGIYTVGLSKRYILDNKLLEKDNHHISLERSNFQEVIGIYESVEEYMRELKLHDESDDENWYFGFSYKMENRVWELVD